MLPSRSGPDANWIRHVYWVYVTVLPVFTGLERPEKNERETHPCKSCKDGQLDLELAESNLIYGLFHSIRLW